MPGVRERGGPVCRMAALVLVIAATFSVTLGAPGDFQTKYDRWQVLEVNLKIGAEDDTPTVNLLELDDTFSMQILRQNNRKGVAEVALSPEAFPDFTQYLENNNITFRTVVEDLGRELELDGHSLRAEPVIPGSVTFERYMSYDEIISYLEELPRLHPDLVNLKQVGRSVEGRPLYLLTIAASSNKPIVFIDGGIHAREWISLSAALNVVERLLESPSLTREVEWRVMPLLNPDGYIHSWTKDRLWRKNRAQTSSAKCPGVDLNRNFDFHWGEAGTSTRPCSTIYLGPEPFSEPEARALRDTLLQEKSRTQAYVTIHSFGQLILHPWGYTALHIRSNSARLGSVGRGMAKAILKGENVTYAVGSPGEILYPAAGASDDFAAGVGGIPLVYTIELRDKGAAGFILPKELILPTVNDAWLAIKYLGNQVIQYGTRETINGLIVATEASVEPEITTVVAEAETNVPAIDLDDSISEAVVRVDVSPIEPQDTTEDAVLSDAVDSVKPEDTTEEAVVSATIASVESEDTNITVVERHVASVELTTETVLFDTVAPAEQDIATAVLSDADIPTDQDIAIAVLTDTVNPVKPDISTAVLTDTVSPAKPDISTAVLTDTVNPAKPDISTAVLTDTVNPAKPDISTAVLTDTINPVKPDISTAVLTDTVNPAKPDISTAVLTDTVSPAKPDISTAVLTDTINPVKPDISTAVLTDTVNPAKPDISTAVLTDTVNPAKPDISTAVLTDTVNPAKPDISTAVLTDAVNPVKPDISTAVLTDTVNPVKPDISTAVLTDTVNPVKPDISTAVLTDTVNPVKPDITTGDSVVEGGHGFYTKVRIQKPEEVLAGTQLELSDASENEATNTHTRVSGVEGDEAGDDTTVEENVEYHKDVYTYSSEDRNHSDEDHSSEHRNCSDEQKDRDRNRSGEQKDRDRNRSSEEKDRNRNRSSEQKDRDRNRSSEEKDRNRNYSSDKR